MTIGLNPRCQLTELAMTDVAPNAIDAALAALAAEVAAVRQAKVDAAKREQELNAALAKLAALVTPPPPAPATPKPSILSRFGRWIASVGGQGWQWVLIFALCCVVGWDHRHDAKLPMPHLGCLVPTPEPPKPITVPLHATLIFDVNAMTSALAAIRTSPTLEPALEAQRCAWRAYDIRDPQATKLGYSTRAAAIGTPALFFVAEGVKEPAFVGKCPNDEAGVIAIVTKLRAAMMTR
jgi:hypothetical protein